MGQAVKDNTPNPGDLAQKAKDAGKKLNNAASDLGGVFDDIAGKVQQRTEELANLKCCLSGGSTFTKP